MTTALLFSRAASPDARRSALRHGLFPLILLLLALCSTQPLLAQDGGLTDGPAIESLVGMRSLEKLVLSGTSITQDGVDQLQQALPELEIELTEGVAEDTLPENVRIFRGC